MAKSKDEKSVSFPQNECVVFGQLAPMPTRVRVSTSQAPEKYENPRPSIKGART